MDKNEFNAWLQTHQKAYPALADWFASLPDQRGTLALWFDVLRKVDKDHGREATIRMMKGVEPLVKYTNWHDTPRFVVEHADAIRRESKSSREFLSHLVDGELTYACRECFDTGIVDVYHSRHVKEIRKGKFRGRCVHRAARACNCDGGRARYRGIIEKKILPIYNAVEDVRVPHDRSACSAASLDTDINTIMDFVVGGAVSLDAWADKQ